MSDVSVLAPGGRSNDGPRLVRQRVTISDRGSRQIEDAGHFPMVEKPRETAQLISEFLHARG